MVHLGALTIYIGIIVSGCISNDIASFTSVYLSLEERIFLQLFFRKTGTEDFYITRS